MGRLARDAAWRWLARRPPVASYHDERRPEIRITEGIPPGCKRACVGRSIRARHLDSIGTTGHSRALTRSPNHAASNTMHMRDRRTGHRLLGRPHFQPIARPINSPRSVARRSFTSTSTATKCKPASMAKLPATNVLLASVSAAGAYIICTTYNALGGGRLSVERCVRPSVGRSVDAAWIWEDGGM